MLLFIMGGIIYVCGLYGAGKSTLIQTALFSIESLKNVTTYITRPPRPSELEDKKLEYHFVSKEEYEQSRSSSKSWDHTEIAGTFYGTDAEDINQRVDRGEVFIIASPNTVEKLNEMQQYYRGHSLVVWINTNLETSNKRLLERDGEKAALRMNDPAQSEAEAARMKSVANVIFETSDNLESDEMKFVRLVSQLVEEILR